MTPSDFKGKQILMGGTNAAGKLIDPAGSDFTLPYAVVARITIEACEDADPKQP